MLSVDWGENYWRFQQFSRRFCGKGNFMHAKTITVELQTSPSTTQPTLRIKTNICPRTNSKLNKGRKCVTGSKIQDDILERDFQLETMQYSFLNSMLVFACSWSNFFHFRRGLFWWKGCLYIDSLWIRIALFPKSVPKPVKPWMVSLFKWRTLVLRTPSLYGTWKRQCAFPGRYCCRRRRRTRRRDSDCSHDL